MLDMGVGSKVAHIRFHTYRLLDSSVAMAILTAQ